MLDATGEVGMPAKKTGWGGRRHGLEGGSSGRAPRVSVSLTQADLELLERLQERLPKVGLKGDSSLTMPDGLMSPGDVVRLALRRLAAETLKK